MKASEVMSRAVATVAPETSLADAVALMVMRRISGLPVIGEAGTIMGILTEGDLLRRVETGTEAKVAAWRAWLAGPGTAASNYVRTHARKVGEIMTAPVISVGPETDLAEVVALMESRRIKRVPVIEQGRLVGIISRGDLVRALDRMLPKPDSGVIADAEVRRRILSDFAQQRWAPRFSIDVRVENGVAELRGFIIDERAHEAMRVLAENTPGVRRVIDHLSRIEPISGVTLDEPPEH